MVRRTGKLSARKVATVGPGKFGDGGGLWLCMKNNGGKSWVFRYMLRGRAREMGLGSLSTISLSESSDDLKKALSAFNDA
ncbi:MAG: Arm DNA-binding domain-containing protein, partial [Sphingomonadales bacterium]